ncbi:hypothetical protein ACFL06_00170 [Patescibacteria group bacterium]
MFYLSSFIPIIIIGLFIMGIARFFRGRRRGSHFLQGFFSKEDVISQIYFLIFIFFLGVLLLALNRQFGDPLPHTSIILITSLIGLGLAYYFKLFLTLMVSLIGVVTWWSAEAAIIADKKDIKAIAVFSGVLFITFLFYLISRFYETKKEFKRASLVYMVLGVLPVTITLFVFSMKDGLRALSELTEGGPVFSSWEITLSLTLFLLVLLGAFVYVISKKLIFPLEAVAIGVFTLLFLVLIFLPEQVVSASKRYWQMELTGIGVLWAAIFNLLTFLELVGFIFLGYAKRKNWLINAGVFLLFVFVFIKYFDWFFTFLDKSIFFIIAGILLFVVGWTMERGRRYMISAIKKES